MRTKASAAIGNKVTLCLGLMIVATIASAFCAFQGFGTALGLRLCVAALLLVPTVLCAARIIGILSSANEVAAQVKSLEREAVDLESVAKAQEKLEENLNALRDLCYKNGDPRVVAGNLCFGDYVINGTNDIVDQVQKQHGGAATIFHGAERISTNVKDQNNKRMVGTRLSQGPAFDKVFNQGKTYRGEATIAGVAYITLYEPVMCGTQVAGIIFVAVAKAQALGAEIETEKREAMDTIRLSTERMREVIIARDSAMRIAAEQRCELTDKRRKQKALERVTALAQQNVVLALSSALDRLASADLTSSIECAFPQEYQKVKDDFGSATAALRKALTAITSETRAIHAGSMEISSAVDELSLRTEKQAASLEETAASLDELTVAVRKTAASVDEARKAVGETRTRAESSRDVMRDAVAAMAEIDKSSRQISQIISVINEIAFQTNLLALNAGVEAARAGEGGRGFAVVAAEVRALAQRSAEAALEIKSLIETSAQQVEKGVDLIGATGSALETITDKVKGVNDIITNIAASTQEQALSLQEINAAITQMDRFTQQNAAMVEESTAASQVLSKQAASLETLVGQFQTGETVVNMAAYAPRRAAAKTAKTAAYS